MRKDTISRQAAIDAVNCGALSAAMVYGRTDEGSMALYETVKAIKALPSAQPTPCDVCRYNPPSSMDGKPCGVCPAERRTE